MLVWAPAAQTVTKTNGYYRKIKNLKKKEIK